MEKNLGFATCVLHKANGAVCGTRIKHYSTVADLHAHVIAHHKEWFVNETEKKLDMQDKLVADDTGAIELGTALKWSVQKVHMANKKLSYLLCRQKCPPHLVADEEFNNF